MMESIGVASDIIKRLLKVIKILVVVNILTIVLFVVYLGFDCKKENSEVCEYEESPVNFSLLTEKNKIQNKT